MRSLGGLSIQHYLTTSCYSQIVNKAEGSAQPNISSTGIELSSLILPVDNVLIKNFNKMVQEIFNKIVHNKKETNLLTSLRDTLLPKLLSGEIEIKNIN